MHEFPTDDVKQRRPKVPMGLSPKLRYALLSTAIGGAVFWLMADMNRFPGEWIGCVAFLAAVFLLALYLHGKVD